MIFGVTQFMYVLMIFMAAFALFGNFFVIFLQPGKVGSMFIVPSGTTGFDLRDTRTGSVIRRLNGHTDSVAAAAFAAGCSGSGVSRKN